MYKNLGWKIGLIAALLFVGLWRVYPPGKTLKPGIDLAGGTSLIYQINTQGLSEEDKRGLSERMITVLRRRIDPANIQNLVWRPEGNIRFEIQMPLASAEARLMRQVYESARTALLGANISQAVVMRSLQRPVEERKMQFDKFAAGDPNKLEILENLAKTHDERKALQIERGELEAKLKEEEAKIEESEDLELALVKFKRGDWAKLSDEKLIASLREFTDANDSVEVLRGYVETYGGWLDVVEKTTNSETGINVQYAEARKKIDQLNLSEDQFDRCLDFAPDSSDRKEEVAKLKAEFQDRVALIDEVVAAYNDYLPFRGRLDDPKDLQRMLKGAGILEFRVLPTAGSPESDPDLMAAYVESLKEKGPRYASDEKYVWCEIEGPLEEWGARDKQERPSIVGTFGEKAYVLASNKKNEKMLHPRGERQWKLEKSNQSQDQYGRRAIGFLLDEWGGVLFRNMTGENVGRPLCILLDGIAISAPNIDERIGRQGVITGSFTEEDQKDMINKLNAGSLPAMLIEQPISVNTIGPSIGAENRNRGIKAGIVGLIVVMVCMLVYYVLSGSIADIALLLNILFVLAIMAAVQATFTLPGIAGIILTIGMSVDANVLIFERIREEQQKGSSLRIAITNGYQRAFRTIFDANLTTFITAAILYWVASEEIKGFAIVLMLGIASSMFTALFVTRVFFDLLLSRRLIKDRLFMLRLIHKPNVNWMRLRPIFFGISLMLILGGAFLFFTTSDKYDIEFTGGTSVQTNFKDSVRLSRQQVEDRISTLLDSVNVYSVGEPIVDAGGQNIPDPNGENIYRQYKIDTGETNKVIVAVTFSDAQQPSAGSLADSIVETQNEPNFSGTLTNLTVTQDTSEASKFVVTTSQMNQMLVKEVLLSAFPAATVGEPQVDETVNNAVREAFADELQVQQNLRANITSEEKISQSLIDSYPELADFIGGVKIAFDLGRATTEAQFEQRLGSLQFKPDTQNLTRYPYRILGSDLNPIGDPNTAVKSFAYVSTPEDAGLREFSPEEWTQFVDNEKAKILAAAELETSLPRVRQFDPSVGAEAKTQALIAIVLSLFAIVTYIWVRFGNVRYGIAAIVALIHDVCITLGAVTACTYIAGTPIGDRLLIGDFKINLAMIAAFLTLIGYSLNDTIVVFDRIRENRGKAKFINPQVITNSINQTISRTILTSFTTFIVVLIMYIFGGQGLRGFTFAIGCGIIVGTYSSIAIAAPILLLGAKTKSSKGAKGKK
ncbi:MAG: protein translocase subunit SecD [Phycisphaerae bacterium]|nr:protein translocase subunit SecD [Phycisphaerae bacterium]